MTGSASNLLLSLHINILKERIRVLPETNRFTSDHIYRK